MALQGEAMALTDTALRELHRRAKRGEKVPMKADGGGLNFQDGKYWRFTFYFAGKKKRLALGVYPDVSLKAARLAYLPSFNFAPTGGASSFDGAKAAWTYNVPTKKTGWQERACGKGTFPDD